ncbi:hypothetical protein BOW53_11260 [Solemya pervernicosa gill symbiont]|uniref:DUF5666 domain-containing protein n=2 Tax=Gammaproteobacteria incertae sedis TaxID=118884 RepID=A0A1T2L313_9GAMM|nr:DUF5666 domain-containing protein [Candidatus Reidiella endopervernicosa]OOZ39483.1 hypothetical protein BOW53_11260 [Solemya pervernicosa gill symbiont]QKQ25892.1 hypothetical protein HUE57_06055 [Candidatus Reidiella endopervernicosa]
MKPRNAALSAAVMTALLGLTACGGGSSSGTAASGGATTTVSGVITGFGSVYVNGVRYPTTGSTITMDDAPVGDDTALAQGMVVTLEVNESGEAESIEYDDELEGLVQANNVAASGTLTVMGMTVNITDSRLVYDANDSGFATLEDIPGDSTVSVEVSGYSDGSGVIYATRVEVKDDDWNIGDSELEIKGIITSLDAGATTFSIGTQVVNYATATLPSTTLADGLYVEVKSEDGFNGSSELIASEIEIEDDGDMDFDGEDGDEVEIRGVITEGTNEGDPEQFRVNGQLVEISGATVFEDGFTFADLVAGVTVEVEGELNADGMLLAAEVGLEEEDEDGETEIKGVVEAVDAGAGSAIMVMDITVLVESNTVFVDERDEEHLFNLDMIVSELEGTGDMVEMDLYWNASEEIFVATKIERVEDDGESEVEGEVTAVDAPYIVVAGITVDISGVGGFSPIVGDLVEVEGSYDAGVLTATEGEIDD